MPSRHEEKKRLGIRPCHKQIEFGCAEAAAAELEILWHYERQGSIIGFLHEWRCTEGGRPCVNLISSSLIPGMQDFFESKEWTTSNAMNILLYQAAYQSGGGACKGRRSKGTDLAL
jgi:hypothetical protein